MELAREGKGSEASEGCSEQRRDLLRHRGWPWMLLGVWTLKSTTYIHTVHIVYSLYLTICEIRRELTVRQQQMDDTVGGEGIWIGNVTAPGHREELADSTRPHDVGLAFPQKGDDCILYTCARSQSETSRVYVVRRASNPTSVCGTTTCWYNDELLINRLSISFI